MHGFVMWLSILESCQVYVVFVFMGALRVNSSLDTWEMECISYEALSLFILELIDYLAMFEMLGWFSCRSKDFDFDVLMMPYDRDVLIPYENALLKFNSRQKSKNTRYNIKKISSDLGREFQIEIAKGLAKKFKLKCLFQEIYSLVIDYQRM